VRFSYKKEEVNTFCAALNIHFDKLRQIHEEKVTQKKIILLVAKVIKNSILKWYNALY